MEVWVSAKPHLLYEAVELMFAYVNAIPAEKLTQDGPYCLPVEAVERMLAEACGAVPREDPEIRYYFEKYVLSEDPERSTCIARNLAYNVMGPGQGSIAGDCQRLCQANEQLLAEGFHCTAIDEYRLVYGESTGGAFTPLAQDIAKLGVSQEYGQKLLEQFSGYGRAVTRLAGMVTPVAAKLAPLLAPWAERAGPLAGAWQAYFSQPDAEANWRKRTRLSIDRPLESLSIQLRYLFPKAGPGFVRGEDGVVFHHIGVAVSIEKKEAASFERWEFQALRLLGSEARMRMLWAMLDKPMSARQLAQSLDMHLGVVSRDINSLFNAKLLITESVDGWNRYRTNRESLNILAKHLKEMEKFRPA